MMEPMSMDDPILKQNQMDDEKSSIQLRKKIWEENVKPERQIEIIQRQQSSSSEDDQIPEIKDIYDQIYGNVQSKRVFYEGQRNGATREQRLSSNGTHKLVIENSSEDKASHDETITTKSVAFSDSTNNSSIEDDDLETPALNGNIYERSQVDLLASPTTTPTIHIFENIKEAAGNKTLIPDSLPSILVKKELEEVSVDTKSDEVLNIKEDAGNKTLKLDSPPSINEAADNKILKPDSPPSISVRKEVEEVSVDTKFNLEIDDSPATPSAINSFVFTNKAFEKPQLIEVPKIGANACHKCQKADFVNDRSEVLTEINANLKLELENVKQQLRNEMAKNNQLNFEIANIEVALETYYKEARNQKSTLSSIYTAMKSYVSDPKEELQEHYTYKRIKMIADYMESLKNKLEHQDKIIKNNFLENPYYTDLIIKHEAVLRQLDGMGKANQEIQEEMKMKAAEEIDIIKELNRQKFQIENKCKEMEQYYRNEIITKEALIRSVEDEYKKQLEDFQTVLDQKDEETAKIQKTATARINNYKQELLIVYRKWKEQKMLNNSNK